MIFLLKNRAGGGGLRRARGRRYVRLFFDESKTWKQDSKAAECLIRRSCAQQYVTLFGGGMARWEGVECFRNRRNMFRRTRYQQGSLQRAKRSGGPDAWIFRWYEDQPNGGKRYRKTVVGTVVQFPTETAARKAADAIPRADGTKAKLTSSPP
jgi:hypothetical protein